MQATITKSGFLEVSFSDLGTSCCGNDAEYVFVISTQGMGQDMRQFNDKADSNEVNKIMFSIAGSLELDDFLDAIMTIREIRRISTRNDMQ